MCSTTWFMCASGHLIEWVTQQQAGCLQEVLHSIWLLMPPTLLVLIQRKPVTSKSQGQVYTYFTQSWLSWEKLKMITLYEQNNHEHFHLTHNLSMNCLVAFEDESLIV